jgi:hypothetical protein
MNIRGFLKGKDKDKNYRGFRIIEVWISEALLYKDTCNDKGWIKCNVIPRIERKTSEDFQVL